MDSPAKRAEKPKRYAASLFDDAEPIVVVPAGATERRVAGGTPTTDLVFSAHVGNNAEVFHQILKLHVPKKSIIADVTFGLGVFWRRVQLEDYTVLAQTLT